MMIENPEKRMPASHSELTRRIVRRAPASFAVPGPDAAVLVAAALDPDALDPAVFDPDQELKRALGRPGLPVTLFVAADGSVRATDVSGALTLDTLRALAGAHLGYAP